MDRYRWFMILILALVACTGCTDQGDGGTTSLPRVILRTDWYAEPEHGGFYLAWLNGYYREAGLDLEIQPAGNPGGTYALVAGGEAHLGLGTSDALMVAMARGIPLVGVMPYFQHDPQGVMFHEAAGIETLEDLDNRTVMISPGLNYVEYLQRALGIRMNLIPMDGGTTRFVRDPSLVQQCFLTSEPYFVARQGVEPRVLPFWDTGFDPYRLVFTSQAYADAHPHIVRAFITASLRGWREYMAGDTAAVFETISARNPQQTPDFMAWSFARMHEYRLTHGNPANAETLGRIDTDRLATQIRQLDELHLLDRPVPVESVMRLDLYPPELITGSARPPGFYQAGGES